MGPTWPFLLMFGSHDMRHIGFLRLTVVNETPGFWGVTNIFCNPLLQNIVQVKCLTLYE